MSIHSGNPCMCSDCHEYRELQELREEVEKLRAENEKLMGHAISVSGNANIILSERVEKLRAENLILANQNDALRSDTVELSGSLDPLLQDLDILHSDNLLLREENTRLNEHMHKCDRLPESFGNQALKARLVELETLLREAREQLNFFGTRYTWARVIADHLHEGAALGKGELLNNMYGAKPRDLVSRIDAALGEK